MLQSLSIRDFAIVPRQEVEFHGGFTAITGETGAGKSLIVDALGLLSGNRSDVTLIRQGADKAELAAEFLLEPDHPAQRWLDAAEMDDQGLCLLRRVISRSGRSRAWINGRPVTLNQLKELGDYLIEIHGQNEHIRLKDVAEQFRLLDHGGGYDDLVTAVAEAYGEWRGLNAEIERLRRETPLDSGELELLKYQLVELESAALPREEVLELEREHKRLARGGEFQAALDFADRTLSGQDSGEDSGGIVRQLNRIASALRDFAEVSPQVAEALRMIDEAAINCDEAAGAVQKAGSNLDLSPDRLASVESTLHALHDLARKHRVEIDALDDARRSLQERIERTSSLEERIGQCEAEIEAALETWTKAAQRLSTARSKRAKALSETVTEALRELAMPDGLFEFAVDYDAEMQPARRGADRVAIRVTATRGIAPERLEKVASGGELSRISLAIRVAHSRLESDRSKEAFPAACVQIFDEVDAGIGGDAARSVGRMLRSVAESRQALCVTHLAQVAVCADHQIKIEKKSSDDEVSVDANDLTAEAREAEIARMLSGSLSDKSLAHARELIQNSAA